MSKKIWTLQFSNQIPFHGHRPIRVHILVGEAGADEQPVADAVSAEQLAVMFVDMDSALNKAIAQHASGSDITVTLRRFEFR